MNNNNSNNQQKKTKRQQNLNFVEALKSIGSSTVNSVKNDLIKGVGQDAINQLSSAPKSQDARPAFPPQFNPDQFYPREEEIISEQQKIQRHKEMMLTPVFDRRNEELQAQLKAIRDELQLLAKDLGNLGASAQKVIQEEIETPGTYHVNFFEKLKMFIIALRKQVNDSANWLEVSAARKQSQRHYWGQVKKSGTKFMLSHDRAVVTQTG